jgi:O-antigen ligase
VLLAALLWVWQRRESTQAVLWHGVLCLPLGLLLYALASMAWAHAYLAGVEAVRWFVLSLLAWLGLNTLTQQNLPRLLWALHWGSVLASLWAVLQFWFDLALFPQAAAPASSFINRNFLAEYLVTALPFSVWALASLRQPRYLGPVAFSLVLNLLALLMTGTRSALIALLVLAPVLSLILLRYRRQLAFDAWRRPQQALVVLVLVAGVLGLGSVSSGNPKIIQENTGITALQRSLQRAVSMTQAQEYTERSFHIRAGMWRATARMILAQPLTGVGAGSWEVQIPLYQGAATSLETDYYAHNEILQLLSEYGLLTGGLFLAVLWAYLLLAAAKTWRLAGAELTHAPLRAVALSSLLALFIVSNAGFPWHLACTGALFALCLAILAASDVQLGDSDAFATMNLRWNPKRAWGALAMLSACSLLALWLTVQAARTEHKLVQAIVLADSLRRPQTPGMAPFEERKAQALTNVREGMAINPHYRKLTAEVAEPFAAGGDWANAVWILESVAASRPHVSAVWSGLADGYSQLGQQVKAQLALRQVQRLKPHAISTQTLELLLLARAGLTGPATQGLNTCLDQGRFDVDMLQLAYALAYKTANWPLAVRALKLRISTWPAQAPDAWLRLGKVYAEPAFRDDARALQAFRQGLAAVPAEEKDNYRRQVPEKYRAQM